jgi:hypothetical protein
MGARLLVSQESRVGTGVSDPSGERRGQEEHEEEMNLSTGQIILLLLAVVAVVLITLLMTGVIG